MSEKLTEDQVTTYVTGEGGCPYCGSRELQGGSVDIDGHAAYQRITCQACGKDWVDGYTLDRVGSGETDEFGFTYARPEATQIIVHVEGGLCRDVYCSDPQANVNVADWDVRDDEMADATAAADVLRCKQLQKESASLTHIW